MKTFAIAVLCGLSAACTTSPRAPVVATGANTMEVNSKGIVAAGAPVGTAVADQTAWNSEIVNQSYVKNGYRVAHRNGQLLYCRSQATTGTFFRSTVCKTDAQMKAAEHIRQDVVDEISRSHVGVCNNPPTCTPFAPIAH